MLSLVTYRNNFDDFVIIILRHLATSTWTSEKHRNWVQSVPYFYEFHLHNQYLDTVLYTIYIYSLVGTYFILESILYWLKSIPILYNRQ